MAKMVVNNNQVPHLWANQSQSSARGNGSISFSGRSLWSYAAEIGTLVDAPDGTRVALLTSQTWSVTTSKHQSTARHAVSHLVDFTVPSIGANIDHSKNLRYLIETYAEEVQAAYRKRELPDWVIGQIRERASLARQYANIFGLPATDIDHEKDLRELDTYHNGPDKTALRAQRKAAKREAREIANRQIIAEWRAGKRRTLPHGAALDQDGGALLRIVGDTLETSRGAEVPLAHAKRIFGRIAKCRTDKTPWERNGDKLPVGSFQVDIITADGSITAGCHLINWPEIENAARLAGVLTNA